MNGQQLAGVPLSWLCLPGGYLQGRLPGREAGPGATGGEEGVPAGAAGAAAEGIQQAEGQLSGVGQVGLGVRPHEERVSGSDRTGLLGYELALPLPSPCPVLPLAPCALADWTVSLLQGLKT